MPHDAVDPVPVACEIVTALQAMTTRRIPVFDPVVVTVASIHAGTTNNVIPEYAVLEGTVRAVSESSGQSLWKGWVASLSTSAPPTSAPAISKPRSRAIP